MAIATKKNLLLALIVFLSCTAVLCFPGPATAAPSVEVIEKNRTGSEIIVDVVMEDVQDIYGASISMVFDPVMLEVNGSSITPGPAIGRERILGGNGSYFVAENKADNTAGRINFTIILLGEVGKDVQCFSGTGVLAQVKFRVKKPGQTAINFSSDARDGTSVMLVNGDNRAVENVALRGLTLNVNTAGIPTVTQGNEQSQNNPAQGGNSGSAGNLTNINDGEVKLPEEGQLVPNRQITEREAPASITVPKGEFTDIKGHWAEREIKNLTSKSIVRGVSEKSFEPDRHVTRAEFCAMVLNLLNDRKPPGTAKAYTDVKQGDWYYNSVQRVTELGFAKGLGNGRFGPGETVTREQLAVMLTKVMELKKLVKTGKVSTMSASYLDSVKVSTWAKDAINVVLSEGIMSGRNKNLIAPGDKATRAECVVLLSNLMIKMGERGQ